LYPCDTKDAAKIDTFLIISKFFFRKYEIIQLFLHNSLKEPRVVNTKCIKGFDKRINIVSIYYIM